MSVNWEGLEITQEELEDLLNFNLLSSWAIDFSRVFLLRNQRYLFSLLFIESSSLFLSYFLFFSLNLIVLRNFNWLTNSSNGFILVFISATFFSLCLLILLNIYLWHKAKKVKIFAVLLEKVKQYNQLIAHLKLLTELDSLNSGSKIKIDNSPEKIEFKKALELTKNSLIRSIELEKVLNRDRHLASNRYQLLANLEFGLVNLDPVTSVEQNDYQQLLTEVVEIGLSVHKEMRKTQILRQ
jgi:hypothetical protein